MLGNGSCTTARMNQLKVNQQATIVSLWKHGWSARRIAREMGFDRDTVSKYIQSEKAKPATPTTGAAQGDVTSQARCAEVVAAKPATLTTGVRPVDADGASNASRAVVPNPATPTAGSALGREANSVTPTAGTTTDSAPEISAGAIQVNAAPGNLPVSIASTTDPASGAVTPALAAARHNVSLCERWHPVIIAALEHGLSAKRIHQDLVQAHDFPGSYQSVKRYVHKWERQTPVPFRRMEFAPGEQLQVDFGTGPWIVEPGGRRRRAHVFRAVLCCSRAGYSEATFDQKTETFLRCVENAFRYFGGVTLTTTPDNLKAAVLHPDWYDPELNPKLAAFAAHYGTVILPTQPKVPRHKGRVERGIDFVQQALKGRSFSSLAAANTFLATWEKNIADTRIHGTTRRHVGQHFLAVERPALQPLPASVFPSFTEGKRRVHLDGHVEFDKAYYSVPPEYTGREVWVRGESRLIRIFSLKMELATVHPRVEPGHTQTDAAHLHPLKRRLADRGSAYLLARCQDVGPHTGAWALAMCQHRGIEGIRVLQGLLALARKTPSEQLEPAAAKALQRAGWRLGDVKQALAEPANVVQVDFLSAHPLIRDMAAYQIPAP